jgi:peptide deformylase
LIYIKDGAKKLNGSCVLQHFLNEVDHLKGRCFIDYVPKDELLSIGEYRARRSKAMES